MLAEPILLHLKNSQAALGNREGFEFRVEIGIFRTVGQPEFFVGFLRFPAIDGDVAVRFAGQQPGALVGGTAAEKFRPAARGGILLFEFFPALLAHHEFPDDFDHGRMFAPPYAYFSAARRALAPGAGLNCWSAARNAASKPAGAPFRRSASTARSASRRS